MMRLQRRDCCRLAVAALVAPFSVVLPRGAPAASAGASVPVGPTATAHDFIDSIGISAHWEQKDGVYGHAGALVAALIRLGIPHVRGFDPSISPLLARHGITAMLVAGPEVGDPARILAIVRRANAHSRVIDAVEGPNEADLFWPMHGYSYNGERFPTGVLAYQRDLYAPDQSGILLIGPSLGRTYDSGAHPNPLPPGSLAQAVDLGNFHPYPFGGNSFSVPFAYGTIARYYWNGNFPSTNLDEFPYATEVYAPPFAPRPMAATETGYPTWRNGISEAVQAKYLPRLFAEYFRLGIRRTYLYELADNQPDPSGTTMEDHFGILRNDLTPKPAFEALRSLIALIAAGAQRTIVGAPPVVTLTAALPPPYDRPAYVHSLLLRLSDTHSLLLVWHEVADADTSSSPPRMIAVPDGRIEITAAAPYRPDAWYAYGPDWSLQRHAAPEGNGPLSVPLQDRIVVISLRRAAEPAP
jgi:hypothetical protein